MFGRHSLSRIHNSQHSMNTKCLFQTNKINVRQKSSFYSHFGSKALLSSMCCHDQEKSEIKKEKKKKRVILFHMSGVCIMCSYIAHIRRGLKYALYWIVTTQIQFNQQMRRQIHVERIIHLFEQIEWILNYYLFDFIFLSFHFLIKLRCV